MKRRAMQKDTHRNGRGGSYPGRGAKSAALAAPPPDARRWVSCSCAVLGSVSLALVGELLSSFTCVATSHRTMFGQQERHRAFGAGRRVPVGTRRPSRRHQALRMHLTP